MDLKTRIETAKANLKRAEQARLVAETQKGEAEKQRDAVIADMAADGVTPSTINDEIQRLEKAQLDDLDKIEKLIPRV